LVEKRHFFIPLAFDAPVTGVPVGIAPPVWYGNTRMVWLSDGENFFKDIFIRFGATHERDRHKDRRTDRHRVPALYRVYAYASRGKNCAFLFLSAICKIFLNFNKFW